MITPTDTAFDPCSCIEARVFRQIVAGEVPAADLPGWRVMNLAAEAIARRKLDEIRPVLDSPEVWEAVRNVYVNPRRITSVLDCGACGTAVEIEHPITREQFAALPDVSWVRCRSCQEAA